MFRKAWKKMDTFDRVVCVTLSAFAFFAVLSMGVFMVHGWTQRIEIAAVAFALGYWPWVTIPADSRRVKIIASICGDDSGPRGLFCTLEPGHRGDHKNFRSNGGMIGWPRKLVVLLFLLLAGSARAQELPEAPRPKVADRQFWISVGVLGAAKTADGITTERMLSRGCYETNPVLGRYPSARKVAAAGSLQFAAEVGLAYGLKRLGTHHRWARFLWILEPSYQTEEHVRYAAHNEALVCPGGR